MIWHLLDKISMNKMKDLDSSIFNMIPLSKNDVNPHVHVTDDNEIRHHARSILDSDEELFIDNSDHSKDPDPKD